jgi:tripartite motif-containing protein 71
MKFFTTISVVSLLLPALAGADEPACFNEDYMWNVGEAGAGAGQFSSPRGLTISGEYLFVADTGNNRIQRWNAGPAVEHEISWGGFGSDEGFFKAPADVAAYGSLVFVVDSGNNRIQVFDRDGVFQNSWGSAGSGDGQFSNPSSIALDYSMNVYVTDTGNHRVQKFTQDGEFLDSWGSEGSGNGQFIELAGISVAAGTNEVFVVDRSLGRVQAFEPDGTFHGTLGSPGSGPGQFNQPSGIWADAYYIYVSDTGNNRMLVLSTSGEFFCAQTGHAFSDFIPNAWMNYGLDIVNSRLTVLAIPDPVVRSTWSGIKAGFRSAAAADGH